MGLVGLGGEAGYSGNQVGAAKGRSRNSELDSKTDLGLDSKKRLGAG